jgi:hypothetical protein
MLNSVSSYDSLVEVSTGSPSTTIRFERPQGAHEVSRLPSLSVEQREMFREGLRQLRQHLVSMDAPSIGAEFEFGLVSMTGAPVFEGEAVLKKLAETSPSNFYYSRELGADQVEVNLSPISEFRGDSLSRYENAVRSALVRVMEYSSAVEAGVVGAGVSMSRLRDDYHPQAIFPHSRYFDFIHTIEQFRARYPSTFGHVSGKTELTIDSSGLMVQTAEDVTYFANTSVLTEAGTSALQLHFGVEDQSDYVMYHRCADLISSLLVAVSANSPFFAGIPTGIQETRLFLPMAGSGPNRYGFGSKWISDPLEQLQNIIELPPIIDLEHSGKEHVSDVHPLQLLLDHSKTFWPYNRTTLGPGKNSDSYALRIEQRAPSIQPTCADNIAVAALFYGLMYGLPQYLKENNIDLSAPTDVLERSLPFERVVTRNFYSCAFDGLRSRVRWINGKDVCVTDLFREVLLPVALRGLRSREINESDCQRYLGLISDRVQNGRTPADIALDLYKKFNHRYNSDEAVRLTGLVFMNLSSSDINNAGETVLSLA